MLAQPEGLTDIASAVRYVLALAQGGYTHARFQIDEESDARLAIRERLEEGRLTAFALLPHGDLWGLPPQFWRTQLGLEAIFRETVIVPPAEFWYSPANREAFDNGTAVLPRDIAYNHYLAPIHLWRSDIDAVFRAATAGRSSAADASSEGPVKVGHPSLSAAEGAASRNIQLLSDVVEVMTGYCREASALPKKEEAVAATMRIAGCDRDTARAAYKDMPAELKYRKGSQGRTGKPANRPAA